MGSSILGTLGDLGSSISSTIGSTNSNSDFLKQTQALERQQLNFQLGLEKQQDAFNDTMQTASESAHENAQLQTFSQDISNARNTLSSSDLQQIK